MALLAEHSSSPSVGAIDEAKRQRLLELVRGRAMARPTDLADDEVMVWPSLVVVEAVSAVVFLLILTALSILVNAPLTARANVNQTPNPSKAPWYFLNLQELLLHMNAGLAGVIIPTIALGAIAAIPYIDRSPLGVGILGTSAKGRKIIAFSAVYTTVVQVAFILLDDIAGTGTQFGIGRLLAEDFGAPEFIYGQVLPGMIIVAAIGVLMALVQSIYRPTKREMIIALFTGFMVTYVVLTIFGTSFRGEGQQLTWPWNLPLEHH
ncbi:MAG: menaquinol-cytochrome C reductase [Chloroflexia bacterium]|jgi:quinol-cytochrome oxidoreductase complex cytochrome b subunit|nr:menaquinol-cytochrome C reductase [Chloroflexia bacterium]